LRYIDTSITKAQLTGINDIPVIIDFSENFFFIGCFFEQPPGQFNESADRSVFKGYQFLIPVLFG
jgi:hypothetical protein